MESAYEPHTLQEAIVYFAKPGNCLNYLASKRWPNGVTCPTCGSQNVIFLANQRRWKCKGNHKRPQFSVKVGTVMEDSPIGLDKWLMAMWRIVNCKNGISSYEAHRAIGITQKSAWFLDHRIRFALGIAPGNKLSGQVDADETFIDGKARNMHKDKRAKKITATGGKDKTAVMGILERGPKTTGTEVRVKVLENTKKKSLQSEVCQHVLAGSAIFTDALQSHEGLEEFQHEVADHAVEHVCGETHTNGLENFWSLVKRGLKGTDIPVEPFRLFRFLDEQVSATITERRTTASDSLSLCVRAGTRLTWDQLTSKC